MGPLWNGLHLNFKLQFVEARGTNFLPNQDSSMGKLLLMGMCMQL